jgi:hypothetical protein
MSDDDSHIARQEGAEGLYILHRALLRMLPDGRRGKETDF